jgi:hypothetical protein
MQIILLHYVLLRTNYLDNICLLSSINLIHFDAYYSTNYNYFLASSCLRCYSSSFSLLVQSLTPLTSSSSFFGLESNLQVLPYHSSTCIGMPLESHLLHLWKMQESNLASLFFLSVGHMCVLCEAFCLQPQQHLFSMYSFNACIFSYLLSSAFALHK